MYDGAALHCGACFQPLCAALCVCEAQTCLHLYRGGWVRACMCGWVHVRACECVHVWGCVLCTYMHDVIPFPPHNAGLFTSPFLKEKEKIHSFVERPTLSEEGGTRSLPKAQHCSGPPHADRYVEAIDNVYVLDDRIHLYLEQLGEARGVCCPHTF